MQTISCYYRERYRNVQQFAGRLACHMLGGLPLARHSMHRKGNTTTVTDPIAHKPLG